MGQKELLVLKDITKVYDNGIIANKGVNLSIREGEVHAIVGENGAGKSTLMKIIFGLEQPSLGKYFLNGEVVEMKNVDQAIRSGIGMVHQHFMLVESMDVVDNIMLGIEMKQSGFIDRAQATQHVKEIADRFMFALEYNKPVSELSIAMKQKVEIMKALVRGAKILILDEPTAVLTPQETKELFVQLKMLSNQGYTILFISHKLTEVKEITDRITVLSKGETKGTFNTEDLELEDITRLMVGRNIVRDYKLKPNTFDEVVLSVENLNTHSETSTSLSDVNFKLKRGMILGVAGVEGNGQSELVDCLVDRNNNYTGEIKLLDESIKNLNLKSLRQKGLSYIPEDRMREGIAPLDTIEQNIISTRYEESFFSGKVQLKKDNIRQFSTDMIEAYDIVASGHEHVVSFLSGGNIQKVVVARECSNNPNLLIAEQPTRGVDLGAAETIHNKLIELRDQGSAILLISADLGEVMHLSDACIVMYDGKITAHIDSPKTETETSMGEYMLGLKVKGVEAHGKDN